MQVLSDPLEDWLRGLDRPHTRQTYRTALKRLSDVTGLTPGQMLAEAQANMKLFWIRVKAEAVTLTPHMRNSACSALRSYLRAYGEFPPNDRLRHPRKVRHRARITWDQALRICDAASPPYRYMFRMQLHCGWGVGEFYEWNRPENWEQGKIAIHAYPPPEYYPFEFSRRKSNDQPFYTLIPAFLLNEIYTSDVQFPLCSRRGQPLGQEHYHTSQVNVSSAFKTALQRSGITANGHLSPHDFRDVFRTETTIKGVDYDAREFALGHTIDPRGYDKCYSDLAWLWKELSKLYVTATPKLEAAKDNQALREQLEKVTGDLAQMRVQIGQFEKALEKKLID